jgi:hypothetical protein
MLGSPRDGRRREAVADWSDTEVGFVGYGVAGPVRAVEQSHQLAGGRGIANVRPRVDPPLATASAGGAVVSEGPHTAALAAVELGARAGAAARARRSLSASRLR